MIKDDKKIKYFVLIIFLLIGFIVFGNSLAGSFVFDDLSIIRDREELKDIEHFGYLLFEPYHSFGFDADAYRPTIMMSYSLNYFLFGEKAWGFHFVNILLHVFSSWFIFLIFLRIFKKIGGLKNNFLPLSFFSSLFFLILPIHTEVINAIVGRSEILSLFFLSLSLLLFLNNKEDDKDKKISKNFWMAIFFLLAMLSKESAIGFLPLWIVVVFLINKKNIFSKKNISCFVYLIFSVLFYFGMRMVTLDKIISSRATLVENPLKFLDFFERIMTVFKILGMYIVRIFWPVNNLSSDYSYNQINISSNFFNILTILGIFSFLIMIYFILFYFIFKSDKKIIFKIFVLICSFFIFFYLPIGNLFFSTGTIMAERLMYIPSIGACLLLGLLILFFRNIFLKIRIFGNYFYYFIILLFIFFYGFLSFQRNFDWKNESTLFVSAAERSPKSVLSLSNRGAIYLIENKIDLAEKDIIEANNIYDDYIHNLNNLGLLYLKKGEIEKAKNQFIEVLKKDLSYFRATDNLALSYFKLGEYEKAEKFWNIVYGKEYTKEYLKYYFEGNILNIKKEERKDFLNKIKDIIKDKEWIKKIENFI